MQIKHKIVVPRRNAFKSTGKVLSYFEFSKKKMLNKVGGSSLSGSKENSWVDIEYNEAENKLSMQKLNSTVSPEMEFQALVDEGI